MEHPRRPLPITAGWEELAVIPSLILFLYYKCRNNTKHYTKTNLDIFCFESSGCSILCKYANKTSAKNHVYESVTEFGKAISLIPLYSNHWPKHLKIKINYLFFLRICTLYIIVVKRGGFGKHLTVTYGNGENILNNKKDYWLFIKVKKI